MNAKFQDIQPKQAGLRCEIQVLNNQGHGILTTFDPDVDNSVKLATKELDDFWNECIRSYKRGGVESKLTPIVNGIKPCGSTDLLDIKAPDFDLSLYEQVIIMPMPYVGG